MRKWIVPFVLGLVLITGTAMTFSVLATPVVAAQDTDADFPPGNPVIGSDRPGDIEVEGDTNYGLWTLVAVCLIAAGMLLVTIERWEARRLEQAERPSSV